MSTTEYGFQFGSALVERMASDDKKGWVVVGIATPKHRVQVYATRTGKVTVHLDGKLMQVKAQEGTS